MRAIRERHNKTPLTMDFDVVIKKAYCNFEQIERENEARTVSYTHLTLPTIYSV